MLACHRRLRLPCGSRRGSPSFLSRRRCICAAQTWYCSTTAISLNMEAPTTNFRHRFTPAYSHLSGPSRCSARSPDILWSRIHAASIAICERQLSGPQPWERLLHITIFSTVKPYHPTVFYASLRTDFSCLSREVPAFLILSAPKVPLYAFVFLRPFTQVLSSTASAPRTCLKFRPTRLL